jgi:phosphoglycolate phosphatase
MPVIEAIFFDIDGTLVDSKRDIAAAVNHMLRAMRLPEKPVSEISSYVGRGVKDLMNL